VQNQYVTRILIEHSVESKLILNIEKVMLKPNQEFQPILFVDNYLVIRVAVKNYFFNKTFF
jgi:uncharacterized Fe-S cluster-containing radical SAM superfamily protein